MLFEIGLWAKLTVDLIALAWKEDPVLAGQYCFQTCGQEGDNRDSFVLLDW
jgi:hypothetical protein